MEKIRKLLEKVEVLPLSPSLLPKLLPALSDVDTNFEEVVRVISMDQSLTAKLLQICNSAFFGQSEPVATVAEAVSRVGYQSVYLLVATINGSNCFPCPSPKGIDTGKLWRHSISAAFNTKFVAESAGLDGNLLFTAGLLHDIGKMVMAQTQPQAMGNAFYLPTTPASVERETLRGVYGKNPFGKTESVSIHDALRSYTSWAAPLLFLEHQVGSLEPGKRADIAVWDHDPYTLPASQLKDLQCQLTFLDGDVVFRSENGAPQITVR